MSGAAGEFEQAERCLRSCELLMADHDVIGAVNRANRSKNRDMNDAARLKRRPPANELISYYFK